MKKNKGIAVKKYNFNVERKSKKKIFRSIDKKTIITIAMICVIIAIVFVISFVADDKKNKSNFVNKSQAEVKTAQIRKAELNKVKNKDAKKEDAKKEESKKEISYLEYYIDLNERTIGYIKIENTNIDYPVVQTDNNEYYINHNFEYNEDKKGAIFMDMRCDVDDFSKTRNIIIYGHRMKDGSMFKDLTKYLDEDFFLQNRIIKFDTINEGLEWKVFAVFETTTDFYYIDTEFPYDEMWLYFLDECNKRSIYKTSMNFYKDDIVLTLSTCTTEEDGRLVVMAKLLR